MAVDLGQLLLREVQALQRRHVQRTGQAALHLAQPMLRKAVEGREDTLTEAEARAVIEECMRVLCTLHVSDVADPVYRDARSLNRVGCVEASADSSSKWPL